MDLKNFKKQMKSKLTKLEGKLHNFFGKVICDRLEMSKWQERPYSLLKGICGCTEQCPFCGEQCDLGEHDGTDVKHTVKQHRPSCVIGWHIAVTNVMTLEICPVEVAGDRKFRHRKNADPEYHPYKAYMDIYPDWHIPPDASAQDSLYWKWFVGKYIGSLASRFKLTAPEVPSSWADIKWENVKTELKGLYNL